MASIQPSNVQTLLANNMHFTQPSNPVQIASPALSTAALAISTTSNALSASDPAASMIPLLLQLLETLRCMLNPTAVKNAALAPTPAPTSSASISNESYGLSYGGYGSTPVTTPAAIPVIAATPVPAPVAAPKPIITAAPAPAPLAAPVVFAAPIAATVPTTVGNTNVAATPTPAPAAKQSNQQLANVLGR